MKFMYPEFLWALSLIAIPIIIHLFNFRKYKKLYFSDISLLKEVKEETKKRSQLKHLLILLSRIIALSALILAFCYPYKPNSNKHGDNLEKTVSVYIDNSLSMDVKGSNGYFLDLAKDQAINIANQYDNDVKFYLLTNDFNPKHQRSLSKNEFIDLTSDIESSSIQKKLNIIYTRQSELLKDLNTQKDVYWLTDLQKSSFDFEQIIKDSTLSIYLIPYQNQNQGNLYIDSAWFDTPSRSLNQQENLYVKIINSFDQKLEFKIDLSINENESRGLTNDYIDANEELISKIPFMVKSPGLKHGTVKISEYPNPNLTFDDNYYFSYLIKDKIKALHLYQKVEQNEPNYFKSLYASSPIIEFNSQQINQADYSLIQSQDLIILDGIENITSGLRSILYECVENGKTIVVYPGLQINNNSYNEFYNPIGLSYNQLDSSSFKIENLNLEHSVFKNVFEKVTKNMNLPTVQQKYNVGVTSNSISSNIISFNDLSPFLIYSEWEKGVIYSFAAPTSINASNFINHALFVPIMLRITELCGSGQRLSYFIGDDQLVETNADLNSSDGLSVIPFNHNDKNKFIPGYINQGINGALIVQDQIQEDGNYNLSKNNELIDGFSFNYNRDESVMDFYSSIDFKSQLTIAGINDQVKIYDLPANGDYIDFKNEVLGILYWKYFIVLTLVFLGIETLLIRIL